MKEPLPKILRNIDKPKNSLLLQSLPSLHSMSLLVCVASEIGRADP